MTSTFKYEKIMATPQKLEYSLDTGRKINVYKRLKILIELLRMSYVRLFYVLYPGVKISFAPADSFRGVQNP